MAGAHVAGKYPEEAVVESMLIDILGTGLLPTYRFLYEHRPDFESFEQWVLAHSNITIDGTVVARCNTLFANNKNANEVVAADVLSAEDMLFWEQQGYVIVKNAVSKEDAAAARKAIMDFLKMDEEDAASWYNTDGDMQGIMVNLYKDAAINKNRHSPRIQKAFEQLWNSTGLVVTADKCGFNPPETEAYKYRGTDLHWDVSLATPIPFGTQGILYLTDTAANQGALTVIPSFHKFIENWLLALPPGVNARQTDFSTYDTMAVAAGAGDLIIWNHKLPHASSPNKAAFPRIVQYINWYNPFEKSQTEWK